MFWPQNVYEECVITFISFFVLSIIIIIVRAEGRRAHRVHPINVLAPRNVLSVVPFLNLYSCITL